MMTFATLAETLCTGRSGVIRADLRTGEVRTAAETETLTYSTEWDGGETVTLAVDGTVLGDARTGNGTVVWTPPYAEGTYVLTHTVVTGGVGVVFSASFYVRGRPLCTGRSGAIRADLRTGAVRVAAATEMLTYSTAWDGGETATVQANGETLCQKTDSGIYEWAPTVGGTYALTHTTVTSEEPVILTAQFTVPYQMGDTTWAVVTNGVCSIYGTGAMKGCDAGDTSPLYAYRSSITNLVIENGVTSIGDRLFENFWYLKRVSLAASVTNIGARAFKKCYGLTYVTSRAKGTATVGDNAFAGCHSLQRLYFAGSPTFGTEAYSFQTAIYMKDGGIPKVYTKPTIWVSGMSGHILGKKALDDAEWTDVTKFSDDAKREYHFFKIEIK